MIIRRQAAARFAAAWRQFELSSTEAEQLKAAAVAKIERVQVRAAKAAAEANAAGEESARAIAEAKRAVTEAACRAQRRALGFFFFGTQGVFGDPYSGSKRHKHLRAPIKTPQTP